MGGREGKQVHEAVWPLIVELEALTLANSLITLVAAMAIATVWAKFVRASTPEATLASVIDDRRIFVSGSRSVEQLEREVRRTREYDADTGTVTNLKKTSCATRRSRDKEAMKKVARELEIRHAPTETKVGYQVALQKTRPRELQNERAKKTTRTVLRVAQLPPSFSHERNQNLLCSMANPQHSNGTELGPPPKAARLKLEQAVLSVFTTRTNTQRSKHVFFFFPDQGTQGGPVAGVAGAFVESDPPSPATARGVAEIVGTSVECCA